MTERPYVVASGRSPTREGSGPERDIAAGSVLDLRMVLPRGLGWARGPIERALGVRAARAALGGVVRLEGRAFVEGALAALGIVPDRAAALASRGDIPASGPLVVVANHPFGIADALLALSIVLPVRSDLKVAANRSLAVFPQLCGQTVAVSVPRARHEALGGTRKLVRHLQAGGAVLIFPAGRGRRGAVEDHPWSPGVGKLVCLSGAAVVPLAFEGANSRSFYLARRVHFRLGILLLLRELLNKRGRRISVHVGELISATEAAESSSPALLTERFRRTMDNLMRSTLAVRRPS